MSQFDKDGFYHGYDLKEKGTQDDGFYHGYDDSNNQGDGFYHGYDDGTGSMYQNGGTEYESPTEQMNRMIAGYRQEHSLPGAGYGSPSDQMDRMVAEYRSEHAASPIQEHLTSVWTENPHQRAMRKAASYERLFPERDAVAENLNDAQAFKQLYPDARLTTARDISLRAIVLFIAGIIFIFNVVSDYFNDVRAAQASQERLASYTAVEGTVDTIQKKSYSNKPFYKVTYIYAYEGKTYRGYKEVSEARAKRMGYGESELPRDITVYVNPKNPSTSMLYATSYPSPLYLLIVALGLIPIGYAIYHYRNCAAGKYVTFTTKGTYVNRVRRYKKVSSFQGVDPSAWRF